MDYQKKGEGLILQNEISSETEKEKRTEAEELLIREPLPAYAGTAKQQGTFTIEDYYELPDEYRCELIDGVIYDMAAPTSIHQILASEIWLYLKEHIRGEGGMCVPICSPIDVQLDRDERTMVQPDVIVICDRDKIYKRCVYGAPDLVVEILSKSTRAKDKILKLRKYREAGVREYWIVDPERRQVIVYLFHRETEGRCRETQEVYGFEDVVPVHIFDGKCQVPFPQLQEEVEFLYEK